jgi:class 3 adenylate cyclase
MLPAELLLAHRGDGRTLAGHLDAVNPQTERFAIPVGGRRSTDPGDMASDAARIGPRRKLAGMDVPEVHYARSGGVAIAYQVIGDGRADLVFVRGFTGDVLSTWEQPLLVRHVLGLAENGRLLMLDKRGTGLSDRVAGVPTLETRTDDVRAVMDEVGSEQAVLFSGQEGTRMTTLFAATYPERTSGLILLDPSAKGLPTPDYPWAATEEEWAVTLRDVREHWGQRDYLMGLIRTLAPAMAGDAAFCDWLVTHLRRSLSPGAAAAFFRMMMEADVSDVLPAVRVPTLILFPTPDRGPAEYFSRRIPHAELVELPEMRGDFTWSDDDSHERTMAAIRDFVAGLHRHKEPDRILATLLFTDIVGSTETQAGLGDRGWKELVQRHNAVVRDLLERHRGIEQDTAGDGFYARFDGPARAVGCALEIVRSLDNIGIRVRAGIHTGECELVDGKCAGLSVSIGARVASKAGSSEVLVSQTVKDLVAGSGLAFEDAGEHELKGVPDRWHLYRVLE